MDMNSFLPTWLALAIGHGLSLGLGLLLMAFVLQQGVNAVWRATRRAYSLAVLRQALKECEGRMPMMSEDDK
ncbi:hypothetical protein [Ideonella livida]|uniref:Uncharacterized protein n=1 Tax=Ideonella livida TaxID=2707176 RepID=A0A7C9TGL6_9BURK|nr:hypothetical protein [Ideonella livida]NDY89740.1 hypothetical protein [Ideonella livida]